MRIPLAAKATALVVAAAAATLIIAAQAVREVFSEGQVAQWQRHALSVVRFATNAVIANPTPAGIAAVAEQLDVDIRYSGPAGDISTRPGMPDPHAAHHGRLGRPHRFGRHPLPHGVTVIRNNGRNYVLQAAGPHRVAYSLRGRSSVFDELPAVLAWSGIAFVVLFGAIMFLLRRMLLPLRSVAATMEAVGTGAGGQVPRPAGIPDEVTSLVDSFNRMSARISDLLEAKERLLRDVSHEVRSPLARLRLRLEYVEDAKLREKLAADLDLIDRLAGELLDRARLQGGAQPACEPVDAGALMRKLHAGLADDQRAWVTVDAPAESLMAQADPRLLARAVGNMLDNSIKYSQLSPGSIVLAARPAAGGKAVSFAVSDQGKQLDEQTVARMRESFYRPDDSRTRSTGGFGLGMAIADAIVRAHGSQLRVSSPPGGGLLCEFELPAVGKDAPGAIRAS